VRNGWYDGVTFHRVLQGFVAQAAIPRHGFGFRLRFSNEITDLKFDKSRLVAMANAGPIRRSQFFITYALPATGCGYTIFGR